MRTKKSYPYPSYKNPIRLSRIPQLAQAQLKELQKRIINNEPTFKRKNDKIPALPFWFEGIISGVIYYGWCFECFVFIREALRHGIIKNRNDARFWGFKEKKALCGDCLEKRLEQMEPRKRWLWS